MTNTTLLTTDERLELPMIINRKKKYQKILKMSIANYNRIFSNCIMVSGSAGSGKTYSTLEVLNRLQDEGLIAGVKRASGHITPMSLYKLLKETSTPNENGLITPLVLDDVDCLREEGCLELMKAAFDTKSNQPQNRQVYYMTETSNGFKYNGFCIIITNDEFKNPNVHQQALLDRVQLLCIDLKKEDMNIYITHTIEKFLNDNEDGLTEEEISEVVDLYNNEVRKWMKTDAFNRAHLNLSNRLIKKFIDAQRMFGEDWKDCNTFYSRLEAASEMAELNEEVENKIVSSTSTSVPSGKKARFTSEPKKNSKGKYVDENGVELSRSLQYYYKKKFAA